MEELNKLNSNSESKWDELKSLRMEFEDGDYNATEDRGKTKVVEGFSDPDRAKKINQELEAIEEEIHSFPIIDSNLEARMSPAEKERQRKLRVGDIMHHAKEAYNKDVEEYSQMSFTEKAKATLTGKKPIANATSEQIIENYGQQARDWSAQIDINRTEKEFNEVADWLKNYYEKRPDELSTTIEERIGQERDKWQDKFDTIQKQNDDYLAEAKQAIKGGYEIQ